MRWTRYGKDLTRYKRQIKSNIVNYCSLLFQNSESHFVSQRRTGKERRVCVCEREKSEKICPTCYENNTKNKNTCNTKGKRERILRQEYFVQEMQYKTRRGTEERITERTNNFLILSLFSSFHSHNLTWRERTS